jgi:hypothetical protein
MEVELMELRRRGFLGLGLAAPLWGRAVAGDVARDLIKKRSGVAGIARMASESIEASEVHHEDSGPAITGSLTNFERQVSTLANELNDQAYELRSGNYHDLDVLSYRSVSPAWQRIQLNIRRKQREEVAQEFYDFSTALYSSINSNTFSSAFAVMMNQSLLGRLLTKFSVKPKLRDTLSPLEMVQHYLRQNDIT